MEATRRIHLTVNGAVYERTVAVRLTLADFLREELHLTGTHLGCEYGVCGACTILYRGKSYPPRGSHAPHRPLWLSLRLALLHPQNLFGFLVVVEALL